MCYTLFVNEMKLNLEQQELFELWLADGNVSQFEPGMYSTQDAQYSNRIIGMDALKAYFIKEFYD